MSASDQSETAGELLRAVVGSIEVSDPRVRANRSASAASGIAITLRLLSRRRVKGPSVFKNRFAASPITTATEVSDELYLEIGNASGRSIDCASNARRAATLAAAAISEDAA